MKTFRCKIVSKEFFSKKGKTNTRELYVNYQGKDYFIKLCESKVKKEDLEVYLNQELTLSFEIKTGNWDVSECGGQYKQSRVGEYIVIESINEV